MNEGIHERARRLIIECRVDGISNPDREWLRAHLESCEACAERAHAAELAVQSLRSTWVRVDPALVSATRLRVRLRAQQLREEQSRTRALWISCALSWVCGAVSAPLVWQALEWFGRRLALPNLVWQMGFLAWWVVPAVAVFLVFKADRERAASENGQWVAMSHWK